MLNMRDEMLVLADLLEARGADAGEKAKEERNSFMAGVYTGKREAYVLAALWLRDKAQKRRGQ